MKDNKQDLGQFYTTNFSYILKNLNIPNHKINNNIIEPFAGNGDILNFISESDKKHYNIECYDLDPQKDFIVKRDTIKFPPDYNNKFILTNPPYLARNKSSDKTLYNKYGVNDLYKCFIKELIITSRPPFGGILIVPLNFLSSIRKSDIELRREFVSKFDIITVNIFEERVFDDTSYTVCSFEFLLKKRSTSNSIRLNIYPSKRELLTCLNESNNYTIGGELYKLDTDDKIKIGRLTKNNLRDDEKECITNILVKCIDNSSTNKLGLSIVSNDNRYIDDTEKLSARSFATLIIKPALSLDKQRHLVINFNKYINKQREKYNSLFLSNYRESKDIARKRISFNLVYEIVNYLLSSDMNQS